MRKFLIIIIIFTSGFSFAQRMVLDSIKHQVAIHQDQDTARAFYLNELAWQYLDYSLDSTQIYYNEALTLSTKINYISGIITSKNVKGILLRMEDKLDEALTIGEEVIELRKKYGPEAKLTGAYTNMGSVYLVKGENAKAINYFNKALEIAQKWKQIENQIFILSNMALVYDNSELNDLALETFQKAVVLNKQLKGQAQEYQQAQLYTNIAAIYDERGLHGESCKYFKEAYDFYKKEGLLRQMSVVVGNLTNTSRNNGDLKGCEYFLKEMDSISKQLNEDVYTATFHSAKASYYVSLNNFKEALEQVNKAETLTDTSKNLFFYATLLGIKADCFELLHNYKKALEFSNRSLTYYRQTDNRNLIPRLYNQLSRIYKATGEYKLALINYEKAVLLTDSLNTENFDTRIATLNSFNQLDKKERELALSNSENEKAFIENKRQTTLLIAGSIVGLLVFVLLIFSLRAYRIKQKDNILLNDQKQEIERKNIGLLESQKEIQHQKDIVDEKQKEIVDSINYAQQIQKTLIANHEMVNETIPDSFVLFKPKDIVSGDFYWATKKDKRFYLTVCDSTGHGVPGAFMSLLNINYLNEAIKEKDLSNPNEVFDHVRKRLIENISQKGRQDGMDGILICIEEGSNIITYAAANNKPVLISDGKFVELDGDKMPVGIGERKDPFTAFSFEVKKGDMLYLYTDGFADQFGGPKGKKFKYKQLEDILLANTALGVYEQEEILKQKFEEWMGNLEQVDDVCILGIRI